MPGCGIPVAHSHRPCALCKPISRGFFVTVFYHIVYHIFKDLSTFFPKFRKKTADRKAQTGITGHLCPMIPVCIFGKRYFLQKWDLIAMSAAATRDDASRNARRVHPLLFSMEKESIGS